MTRDTPPGGRLLNAGLAALTCLVCLGGLEWGLRLARPWLLPERAERSQDLGLPRQAQAKRLAEIERSRPELVFIGDSFVESGLGPRGFVSHLGRVTSLRLGVLGFSSACPSQYFLLFDRLRASGSQALAVVLLYLGNDLFDEALWARDEGHAAGYLDRRRAAYADPAQPQFWPCLAGSPSGWRGWLQERSALWRTFVLLAGRGHRSELGAPGGFMERQCDQPPWSERVRGRLFFFRSHEALLDPASPDTRLGLERITAGLEARRGRGLVVVPVFDREENCGAFHGRDVRRAAALVEQWRASGLDLVDPNPPFAERCGQTELYLPDGHWNPAGQRLLARALQERLLRPRFPGAALSPAPSN